MLSTIIVQPGKNSLGEWSCPIYTTGWAPLTYRAIVTPVNPKYGESVSAQFNLTERQTPTPTILAQNTTASPAPVQNFTQITTIPTRNPPQEVPTTQPASLPLAVSIVATGMGIIAFRRYRKN